MQWKAYSSHGCPCKDCEDREIGCHGWCERFAGWKAEVAKAKEAERLYLEGNSRMSMEQQREIWRYMRYSRQNRKGIRPNCDR